MDDQLAAILARKRLEIARRKRHGSRAARAPRGIWGAPDELGWQLERSPGALPKVIAEIKHGSPSAGVIRERTPGAVAALARNLESAGAAAISVLADRVGFGGSLLDVRRAATAVRRVPVLYKEFVLDECQLDAAEAAEADLALLLVRALDDARLHALIRRCQAGDLYPLVEVADERELERALATDAFLIGVNARDLRTFRVAPAEARRLVEKVPQDRIAVYMSGVSSREDLLDVAATTADAVLIGEGLMRTPDPAATLAEWLR